MNIEQTKDWPEGMTAQGVVLGLPDMLGLKLDLEFHQDRDDFAVYQEASGYVDGEPFALLHYEGGSLDGTAIYGSPGIIERLGLKEWTPGWQLEHNAKRRAS